MQSFLSNKEEKHQISRMTGVNLDKINIGIIIDTHYDKINDKNNYNTIDIKFLTGKRFIKTNVKIGYPFLSNNLGDSSIFGMRCKPDINTYVACYFLPNEQPVIFSYFLFNEFKQNLIYSKMQDVDGFSAIRDLISGEISITSKWAAEQFFDKNGAINFIVSKQDKKYNNKIIKFAIGEKLIEDDGQQIKDKKNKNVQILIKNYKDNVFNFTVNEDGDLIISLKSFSVNTSENVEINAKQCNINTDNCTIKSKMTTLTGGKVKIKGKVNDDMEGGFNCLKQCLFTGVPHSGSEISE